MLRDIFKTFSPELLSIGVIEIGVMNLAWPHTSDEILSIVGS